MPSTLIITPSPIPELISRSALTTLTVPTCLHSCPAIKSTILNITCDDHCLCSTQVYNPTYWTDLDHCASQYCKDNQNNHQVAIRFLKNQEQTLKMNCEHRGLRPGHEMKGVTTTTSTFTSTTTPGAWHAVPTNTAAAHGNAGGLHLLPPLHAMPTTAHHNPNNNPNGAPWNTQPTASPLSLFPMPTNSPLPGNNGGNFSSGAATARPGVMRVGRGRGVSGTVVGAVLVGLLVGGVFGL